jgi:hypothetical protein
MISMIRSTAAIPTIEGVDEAPARAERPTALRNGLRGVVPLERQPIWIHLPIAEAERLSPNLEMPRYCETLRCRSKQRTATTFHAVIGVPGQPDYVWVACADCTGLMIEDDAT